MFKAVRNTFLTILAVAFAASCSSETETVTPQGNSVKSVNENTPSLDAVSELLKVKLGAVRPELEVTSLADTPVAGIYEATINFGGNIYVSENAEYFFLGELFQITPNRLVNVTEQGKNEERAELMANVSSQDGITFSPKGEVKAQISVFTDVDCGYCRKLHQEMAKLNDMGIEVTYLAFPRAGLESDSFKKIASAWCSDDQQSALTTLKNGKSISENVCTPNPVAEHYALGNKVGVRGTPSIVLESGVMIPGYMPADRLAAELGI